MIAAIERDGFLHAVRWTGRVRLHVEIQTYCGLVCDAGSTGVLQVNDTVFAKALAELRPDVYQGAKRTACPQCRTTVNG